MTAPVSVTHPCEDCEIGACPCGSGCESCQHTGECPSCWGSGQAPGPARDYSDRNRPTGTGRKHAVREPGRKPAMPECPGCGRRHRCDTAFYGLTPDQVRERVNASISNCDRPRCAVCSVPFGGRSSRWLTVAIARGAAEKWTFTATGTTRVEITNANRYA